MNRLILLAVCVPAAAVAQIANFRVVGVTHMQAVIAYTSPVDYPCSVEVSQSPSLRPLVHDVDPALFPGAGYDSREPGLGEGRERAFVIGRRRSDAALDGRLYSRALEVAATHYVNIRCGDAQYADQFTTRNLPLGDTYPDPPPFHADGFGNYGWPSIDWTDRNRSYIDPMTGVRVKRLSDPADIGGVWTSRLFHPEIFSDPAGVWTNAENGASGSLNRTASTSAAGKPLFLGVDPDRVRTNAMVDMAVRVFGSADDAVEKNREISICLTIDSGQSCFGKSFAVTLPTIASQTGTAVPGGAPAPGFARWGKALPMMQLTLGSGTASVRSGVLTRTGGPPFRAGMAAGAKIRVPGSHPVCARNLCTVQSVRGDRITLIEDVTIPNASWASAEFGVRVTKTTGTGNVSLTLNYDFAFAESFRVTDRGNDDRCSRAPVTAAVDAAGSPLESAIPGYICSLVLTHGGAVVYWIGENGEARPLSVLRYPPSIGGPGEDQINGASPNPGGQAIGFDPDRGNVMYTTMQTAGGKTSIYRITYTGDYRSWSINWATNPGGDIPWPLANADRMRWENITPPSRNRDIQAQVDANYPSYDKASRGVVTAADFQGISGRFALFNRLLGFQDSVCDIFVFDVTTGAYYTGFSSHGGEIDPRMKWSGCHSVGPAGPPDSFYFSFVPLNRGGDYGGPYQTKIIAVKKNGEWSGDTSIPPAADGSYDPACPPDLDPQWLALGAAESNCITMQVASEPCSANAGSKEKARTPCPSDPNKGFLQNMAEGDVVFDTQAVFQPDSERLRIVRKVAAPGGGFEIVVQRWIHPVRCGPLDGQRTHRNGWSLTMTIAGCQADLAFFTPGQSFHLLHYGWRGHFDLGVGEQDGEYRQVVGISAGPSGPVALAEQPPSFPLNLTPGFASALGADSGLQSYPSLRQWRSAPADRLWMLDFNHTEFMGIQTSALQPETASVYKVNIIGRMIDPKRLPFLVYAGPNLLRDKSGPQIGDTLKDSDPWSFCFAYRAGECRASSAAGDLYAVVPSAAPMTNAACPEAEYSRNTLCAMSGQANIGFVRQHAITRPDPLGHAQRRLTMGLSGPGRQAVFANARSTPDGKWAIVPGYSLDGLRNEMLLVKLPPFPEAVPDRPAAFRPVAVEVPAVPGVKQALIDFGYAEYGSATDFFCTPRAESCSITTAALEPNSYFKFEHEIDGAIPCESGCSVELPGLPNKVIYYRIRFFDGATRIHTTQTSALVVP